MIFFLGVDHLCTRHVDGFFAQALLKVALFLHFCGPWAMIEIQCNLLSGAGVSQKVAPDSTIGELKENLRDWYSTKQTHEGFEPKPIKCLIILPNGNLLADHDDDDMTLQTLGLLDGHEVSVKFAQNSTEAATKDEIDTTQCNINVPFEVVIPGTVTEIGDRAFARCHSLERLTIPDSVSQIEDAAFTQCMSLKSLEIPRSVTHIGNLAFAQCHSLERLTIPDSVTHLGNRAFEGSLHSSSQLSLAHEFTAEVKCLPQLQHGVSDSNIFVTVTSQSGATMCPCSQVQGETLEDLELQLLKGPMSNEFCSNILSFYTEDSPDFPHSLKVQLHTLLDIPITLKQDEVGLWLNMFPDTGKFLEAMKHSKFDPSSPNFQVNWTAEGRYTATRCPSTRGTLDLVQEQLGALPIHAESQSQCRFIQIFGRLTSEGEAWTMFNLQLLQKLDPGINTFKHHVCQHWLELAGIAATSKISPDPSPILLLAKNHKGSVVGIDIIGRSESWPNGFGRNLQNSLRQHDKFPNMRWDSISRALLSLDWDFQQEGTEMFNFVMRAAMESKEMQREFDQLQPGEVLQMVHAQLCLSCVGFAEVEVSRKPAWVDLLAGLLHYQLKTQEFQSLSGVEKQNGILNIQPVQQACLTVVTGIPPSKNFSVHPESQRVILCYTAAAADEGRPTQSSVLFPHAACSCATMTRHSSDGFRAKPMRGSKRRKL